MGTWGHAKGQALDRGGRPARKGDRDRERDRLRQVLPEAVPEIERALGHMPTAQFLMTAAFENRRAGILVSRVMRCSVELASVCVAVPSGQRLATLIRDSHAFGLCMIDRGNRVLQRRFAENDGGVMSSSPAPIVGDPFDTLDVRTLVTGSPLLAKSIIALDCEVVRHLDLESDHEIYVGQVLAAFVGAAPDHVPGRDAGAV